MNISFISFRSLRRIALMIVSIGGFTAGGAGATISESAVPATTGGYSLTDQFTGATTLTSNNQSFLLDNSVPGAVSELGVTVSADVETNGNFSFEHNLYRLGVGSAKLTTTLTDTVTNSGNTSAALRFDSQITPGHLAAYGNDSSNVVFFQFSVTQISGSQTTVLYTADGSVTPGGLPSITTSDGSVFNGLQSYSDGAGRALDWSATNLDLILQPIQASSSSIILYQTTTYVTGGVACDVLSSCQGTQVAFGDPRNDGGVPPSLRHTEFGPFGAPPAGVPLIGRLYDPYTIPLHVVPIGTPLPPTPPVIPPVNYLPPGPVPEPQTWAMLLVGLAVTGGALRRREHERSRLI